MNQINLNLKAYIQVCSYFSDFLWSLLFWKGFYNRFEVAWTRNINLCITWYTGYGTGVPSGTSSDVFSNGPFFSSRSFPPAYHSTDTEVEGHWIQYGLRGKGTSHTHAHICPFCFGELAAEVRDWRGSYLLNHNYRTSKENLIFHRRTWEQSLQTLTEVTNDLSLPFSVLH